MLLNDFLVSFSFVLWLDFIWLFSKSNFWRSSVYLRWSTGELTGKAGSWSLWLLLSPGAVSYRQNGVPLLGLVVLCSSFKREASHRQLAPVRQALFSAEDTPVNWAEVLPSQSCWLFWSGWCPAWPCSYVLHPLFLLHYTAYCLVLFLEKCFVLM